LFWGRRWEFVTYALLFGLLEGLAFAPFVALVGETLVGHPVVDSTKLVAFVLSPRGFLVLFIFATIAIAIRLVEQAGLSVIALGALNGVVIPVRAALRVMLGKIPRLIGLAAQIIGRGLLIVAPLLAVIGFFAQRLLSRHDMNYYLTGRQPELITSIAVVSLATAITLAVGGWYFVRWRLVVQVCVFQRCPVSSAFRESELLVDGAWWKVAGRYMGVGLLELALVGAEFLIGECCVLSALALRGESAHSVAFSFAVLLLLRVAIAALISVIGATVAACIFTSFYQKRCRELQREPSLSALGLLASDSKLAPEELHWTIPTALVIGLIVFAISGTTLAADALSDERRVLITAHRGNTIRAPENTLAAIREAIEVGADFAEIDVQMSKDDFLVTHDSDFSRLGGVARRVWDLTYDEIREIPVGGSAAPQYRDERIPTLEEVLGTARDRIKINIELKYYGDHQPGLADKVVKTVRAQQLTNQVIVQSLSYAPLREAHRLAPELPVGYIFSVNARFPKRLNVNFLSVAYQTGECGTRSRGTSPRPGCVCLDGKFSRRNETDDRLGGG